MKDNLFPDEALAILREARWDANAQRSYEIMSGGFRWSDERLGNEVACLCIEQGNWTFRFVLGYRASLSRGAPRKELQAPWEQLKRECPEWPGFRPERSSLSLAVELDAEQRRVDLELDELDRRISQRGGQLDS